MYWINSSGAEDCSKNLTGRDKDYNITSLQPGSNYAVLMVAYTLYTDSGTEYKKTGYNKTGTTCEYKNATINMHAQVGK